MYPVFTPEALFLAALAALDRSIAADTREGRCRDTACGGPLDFSTWQRKPRGGPDLPDRDLTRWGLCCRVCRKRVLPPSVLFLGRHVYSKPVIILVVAARQRTLAPTTLEVLRAMFGVSRETIGRWVRVFLDRLPVAAAWQRVRGRLRVRDQDVPALLLDLLIGQDPDRDHALLRACELVPGL